MTTSVRTDRLPRNLRYIVFDLFHTLVDPEDFRPREFRRAERVATILQIDLQPFSSYWSNTLDVRNARPTPIIRLVEEYLSRIGKECSPEILSQVNYELGRYQDMAILNPRPEVISPLETLTRRGYKLGLLTNCDEREAREWTRSPLFPWFQAACFSFEIGYQKPAREAYQTILDRLRASPSEAAYVGDGSNDELKGARDAGLCLIIFMKGFVSRNGLRNSTELESFQETADVTVESLEELPDLLERRAWT